MTARSRAAPSSPPTISCSKGIAPRQQTRCRTALSARRYPPAAEQNPRCGDLVSWWSFGPI
jgi:hypothetical protein